MSSYTIKLLPISKNIIFTPAEWQIILLFVEVDDFDKLINVLRTKQNMDIKVIETMLLGLQKKGVLKLSKSQSQSQPQKTSIEIPELFWETINVELSKFIGPIASIVIDDTVDEFNYSKETFPKKFLFSFVENVAKEISSAVERNLFQKAMLNFIKQNI